MNTQPSSFQRNGTIVVICALLIFIAWLVFFPGNKGCVDKWVEKGATNGQAALICQRGNK